MPFAEEGALDGQARTQQKPPVAPAEAIPVDVGEVFVSELAGHGHAKGDIKLIARVATGAAVLGRVAHEVDESGVGEGGEPVAEAAGALGGDVVGCGGGQVPVERELLPGLGAADFRGVEHGEEAVALEAAPVGGVVLAARGDAAPDDDVGLLRPGRAVVVAAGEAFFVAPVHGRGEQDLVVDGQLGAAEHGEELFGGADG